jgi:P pilus assembly chaperone PapD
MFTWRFSAHIFSHCRNLFIAQILFLGALASPATALQVSPMVFDLSTLGRGANQSITVRNPTSRDMPVELRINRFTVGQAGETIESEGGDDDFLLFPPQTIIPAGRTQTFRVQWVGDPNIAQSQSYNVVVQQIPVRQASDAGETQFNLQIVMAIATVVTVKPPSGSADVSVVAARGTRKDGKPAIALSLKNAGNVHTYLRSGQLRISGGGWQGRMDQDDLAEAVGYGLLQPGNIRDFVIVVPGMPAIDGPVDVRIEY